MLTEAQRQSVAISYRLTPKMVEVLTLLLEVPLATNKMIERCVDGDGTPAKIVVYRLRSQLQYTTIKIHKRNKTGYWLDDGTKFYIMQTINQNIRHLKEAAE